MKNNSTNNNFIEYIISEESKGLRLDQAISKEYDQYSRSLIQKWIKKEKIEAIEIVKEYYGYNTEKARQSVSILSKEQIDCIKSKLYKGGK